MWMDVDLHFDLLIYTQWLTWMQFTNEKVDLDYITSSRMNLGLNGNHKYECEWLIG